jgi:arylsulfatase A-like enzyme
VPKSIDRTALFSPDRVSDADQEIIEQRYRESLSRADAEIERLVEEIDATEPLIAFTSDHGDEFGEEGHYFHQPQRRRVVDALTTVPVSTNDLSMPEPLSLLDIGPTLLGAVDADVPVGVDGQDVRETPRKQAITVAPWHDTATVAWRDFERGTTLVSRDADVSLRRDGEQVDVSRDAVDEDLKQQMRDLGYVE